MYVRKTDVTAYGRTPGCPGCRDLIVGKAQPKPHTRESRARMARMLSESEAGRRRLKAAEDRWVNAAVRRSDLIFAEADEKKIRTQGNEPPPAVEATLTGGSSASGAAPAASSTVAHAGSSTSRKTAAETAIEDIDPIAGDAADTPSVTVEKTGVKRQADATVADIDPRSGDGTDMRVQLGTDRGVYPESASGY